MTTTYFKYCPRCSSRFVQKREDPSEPYRLACPKCGFILYQNSSPCTEALIVRGTTVLLVRRAMNPRKGFLDIPGGFLENGESPETGIKREVREELQMNFRPRHLVGCYIDSYLFQGWKRYTLNLSYFGSATGTPRPGSDAKEAVWVDLKKLPKTLAFSHQLQTLRDLKRYLKIR